MYEIDEAARESLAMPEFPPPALTLSDLDAVLNRQDLRPPWLEWSRLDPGSYSARMPGIAEPLRITTDALIFDYHADSHVFLSPGGEWFGKLLDGIGEVKEVECGELGRIWLIERGKSVSQSEVVASLSDEAMSIRSIGELLAVLDQLGPERMPPERLEGVCKVSRID